MCQKLIFFLFLLTNPWDESIMENKYKALTKIKTQMKNFDMFAGEYFYFSFYFFYNESRADLPCDNVEK